MTARVLFVDDDHRLIARYADAVRELGLEAECIHNVDDALKYLKDGHPADVIVWDMMIAPGKAFANQDTRGGLATGTFLYRAMRELRPEAVFILLRNPKREEYYEEADRPEQRSYFRSKPYTSPPDLATLIAELTGTSVQPRGGEVE